VMAEIASQPGDTLCHRIRYAPWSGVPRQLRRHESTKKQHVSVGSSRLRAPAYGLLEELARM